MTPDNDFDSHSTCSSLPVMSIVSNGLTDDHDVLHEMDILTVFMSMLAWIAVIRGGIATLKCSGATLKALRKI